VQELLFVGGFFLFIYLIDKIGNYFDEKKAKKELPALQKEVDELRKKREDHLKYMTVEYIPDSVKEFRKDYEQKQSNRTYYAQKRYRKRR